MTKRNLSFGWVEAAIRYGGVFGAAEKLAYRDVFGLSEPTVSRHQAEFEELFENACGPVFLRDPDGRVQGGRLTLNEEARLPDVPVFSSMPRLERWLDDMFGGSGYVEADVRPPDPDLQVVRSVVRAIRSETPLVVRLGTDQPDVLISPHVIFRIKGQLFMRGYAHRSGRYENILLHGIIRTAPAPGREAYVNARDDEAWSGLVTVRAIDRGLGAVRASHDAGGTTGLDESTRTVQMRKALLPFFSDEIAEGHPDPDRADKVMGKPGTGSPKRTR